MFVKTFAGSIGLTVVGLAIALIYAGPTGLAVAAILGVLEISLSFDNAVVNAGILKTMNPFWQKIFLTVGILIAVVGMRLLFPLVIVALTAKLSPARAISLALDKGDPNTAGTYGFLLRQAHPAIAAFGGAFLLMLFLNFIFEEREITWLSWLERPLARIGKLDQLAVVVSAVVVALVAYYLAPQDKISTVLLAGLLGLVSYILVNGLGALFDDEEAKLDEDAGIDAAPNSAQAGNLVLKAGKAAFFSFLYLEVLDASFSFDGVIGAFAITADPIIIAVGLGLIGAPFIRSLTVYLVRQGTLDEYVYLEHGAEWAIGALAIILLFTIRYEVPEVVTGLVGIGFIGAAFLSSLIRNKRSPEVAEPVAASLSV
ncbi:MAG: DUF475 domain-containing protein [Jatrophihabitantaceae bacterium]